MSPPAAFDPAWSRDGLDAKPPAGMGERAHWLAELLALVPPAHWTARFAAAPADLVAAAMETDWADALLEGWSRATRLHATAEWAYALWVNWHQLADGGDGRRSRNRLTHLLALYDILSDAEAVDVLPAALAEGFDPGRFLGRFPRPWSTRVTDVVLELLRTSAATRATVASRDAAVALLEAVGRGLPIERRADVADLGETGRHSTAWHLALDRLERVLELRARLDEDLHR